MEDRDQKVEDDRGYSYQRRTEPRRSVLSTPALVDDPRTGASKVRVAGEGAGPAVATGAGLKIQNIFEV